jgi:O-Antigen ligase
MSFATATEHLAVPAPRLATESLRAALLWLMGLAGGFVFIEPSPYEIVGLLAMIVFGITGLSMRPALSPLVLLLVLMNIGYATAMVPVADQPKLVLWVLISAFLAGTAILYALVLGSNTQARLRWLLRGTTTAAVIAALIAIAAYFRLFGSASDFFLLYDRARGTFNDPNVLGAFLVLPALLAFQRVLTGRPLAVIGNTVVLFVLLAAMLLTFSRASWGQFAFCAVVLMAITFASTRAYSEKLRIFFIALSGALAFVALVMLLLSNSEIAEQFKTRAALEQDYDVGHYGRFGRYLLGAELALDHPLGLGPLQFARKFVEDPHNTFLNTFMSGGWLAGFCYLTLCVVTATKGLRFLFTDTPWRPTYQVIYVAYLGVILESAVVDIDHWRHYFLILGALWGMMAASRAWLASGRLAARAA